MKLPQYTLRCTTDHPELAVFVSLSPVRFLPVSINFLIVFLFNLSCSIQTGILSNESVRPEVFEDIRIERYDIFPTTLRLVDALSKQDDTLPWEKVTTSRCWQDKSQKVISKGLREPRATTQDRWAKQDKAIQEKRRIMLRNQTLLTQIYIHHRYTFHE